MAQRHLIVKTSFLEIQDFINFFNVFFPITYQADLIDLYLCHWKRGLLFVLPTMCFRWSSVKTLVTIITLPLGRLTGGLQVKWCQASSLTSMLCPERSLSRPNTLTCLMGTAKILPPLPWSCLTVHICISLCGLLHLTKSSSACYQTLSLILLISGCVGVFFG